MSPKAIGGRIKRLRKARSLTQAQLAKKVGVSVIHIANLESPDKVRHHRNPSLKTLERIARALHVTVSDLLGDAPTKGRNNEPRT